MNLTFHIVHNKENSGHPGVDSVILSATLWIFYFLTVALIRESISLLKE